MTARYSGAYAEAAARHGSILDRLQGEIDQLPNALARIAKYILENPEKVLHQSVAELGEFASSGEASILRLCRQIGFSGFREFKLALAAEVGPLGLAVTPGAETNAGIELLYNTMIENLSLAYGNVDTEMLDKVAVALADSRRIDLYGAGMSGISAEMLAFKLLRLGLTAVAFRDSHMAHQVASGLGPNCVAIGLSVSGLTDDTLQFLKGARAAGATTIAITSRARSPIGEAADLSLQAAGLKGRPIGGALTSMVGKVFLIECLMQRLGQLLGREYLLME